MTERRLFRDNNVQNEWLMCPTCRQRTDFRNIAYADDRQNNSCDSDMRNKIQDCEKSDTSLTVQGSYGTKVYFLTKIICMELMLMYIFRHISILVLLGPINLYTKNDLHQRIGCPKSTPTSTELVDNLANFFYGIVKIEAVTRRILWIKSTDPKAKVLVFSSWNDVLDVLEHAFVTNNVTCIRMKGGR